MFQKLRTRKWFRRGLIFLSALIIVGIVVACLSLQPSLSLAYLRNSSKQTYETTLNGEPFVMPYRIMLPEDSGSEHSYPIVLYLCGSGQCGRDNTRQGVFNAGFIDRLAKAQQKEYSCIVLAPQIPNEPLAMHEDILAGYMGLVEAVQKKYNADPKRLYIIGFSMGGDSIWALLERYPEKIAAAVPICGGLGHPEQAERFKDVPVWMFHGKLDWVYPVGIPRKMADALKAAGGNIKYTEYAVNGHICWHRAYAEPELVSWMFSQYKKDEP